MLEDTNHQLTSSTHKLHVIAVATKNSDKLRLVNFKQMCRKRQLDCIILGKNDVFKGFGWMFTHLVIPTINNLPKDDLVIVADALDILIQGNNEDIILSYQETIPTGNKVVVSLETNCPNTNCPDVIQRDATPTGIPNLQHINGGFVFGPVMLVENVLQIMSKSDDPQGNLGKHVIENPEQFWIDKEQRFCATIVNAEQNEWNTYYQKQDKIQNKQTMIAPHFIHFPGTQEKHRKSKQFKYRLEAWDDAYGSVDTFKDSFRGGGMTTEEQQLLVRVYAYTDSVFEWGMGSSTLIASHLKMDRITAVDSAKVWVEDVKKLVSNTQYKLQHADIGPIIEWGEPKGTDFKQLWPSYSQQVDTIGALPYDVYLVDGRFRVACAARALLHGYADSLVLVHDFKRQEYQVLLEYADKIIQTNTLVVLQRKENVLAQLEKLWEEYKFVKY